MRVRDGVDLVPSRSAAPPPHRLCAGPDAAQAADAVKVGGCLLRNCQVELARCIGDVECLEDLVCLNLCNDAEDEVACQVRGAGAVAGPSSTPACAALTCVNLLLLLALQLFGCSSEAGCAGAPAAMHVLRSHQVVQVAVTGRMVPCSDQVRGQVLRLSDRYLQRLRRQREEVRATGETASRRGAK